MDRKRLAAILPWIVGAGFCLVAAMKLAFQLQATGEKDAASGHTEAIRFAPVISADWDYITEPQLIALCVVMIVVMVLAAAMATSPWWARDRAEDAADTSSDPTLNDPPSAPPALRSSDRKPFGRAR
jgi:hypothetical protein